MTARTAATASNGGNDSNGGDDSNGASRTAQVEGRMSNCGKPTTGTARTAEKRKPGFLIADLFVEHLYDGSPEIEQQIELFSLDELIVEKTAKLIQTFLGRTARESVDTQPVVADSIAVALSDIVADRFGSGSQLLRVLVWHDSGRAK